MPSRRQQSLLKWFSVLGLSLAVCACAHCRPCEECGPRACTSQDCGSKSGWCPAARVDSSIFFTFHMVLPLWTATKQLAHNAMKVGWSSCTSRVCQLRSEPSDGDVENLATATPNSICRYCCCGPTGPWQTQCRCLIALYSILHGWNSITMLTCKGLASILRFFSDFLQLVGAPLQKAGTSMM